MKNWFLIARPVTLFASVCPVLIALFGAYQVGCFDWLTGVLTLISALSIQVLSNFFNDYYDFKRGADGVGRLGPKRAISEGWVSVREMFYAIVCVGVVAVSAGSYLVFLGGVPILVVGVSGLFFAWLYTATRFSLSYLGVSDVFVLFYFGPVATVGSYYLQTGLFSEVQLWAGVGCGLISMGLLTVNNLRDYAQDLGHGKRTLVVRLGVFWGSVLYFVFLSLAVVIGCWFVGVGFLALGLGVVAIYGAVRGRRPEDFQRCLKYTTLYLIGFTLFWIVGSFCF